MRVLFTGATGVIGEATVPLLVGGGHEVRAVARDEVAAGGLRAAGAMAVDVDLFDPVSVRRAVDGVDAVVHMATSIPAQDRMVKRKHWEGNDRLRRDATGVLVDACLERGVGRFVQQSISLVYDDGGDRWLDESAPVDPVWDVMKSALDAEAHVSRFCRGGGSGVVLRMASLYGPGRVSAEHLAAVATRKIPVVGDGHNYVSRLHVADAATAIGAALSAPGGTYNVADPEPITTSEELRLLADELGARLPRRVPPWLARAAVGPAASLLTVSHRVCALRFGEVTGWRAAVGSSRDGWRDVASQWHCGRSAA